MLKLSGYLLLLSVSGCAGLQFHDCLSSHERSFNEATGETELWVRLRRPPLNAEHLIARITPDQLDLSKSRPAMLWYIGASGKFRLYVKVKGGGNFFEFDPAAPETTPPYYLGYLCVPIERYRRQ